MKLRLSDPAYSERLVAFLEDLGHTARAVDGGVELDQQVSEAELAVYLRVWSVLEPDVGVTVDG